MTTLYWRRAVTAGSNAYNWSYLAQQYETVMPKRLQKPEFAMIAGLLYGLAMSAGARVIVEIGVQYGISTRMLCLAAKQNGGRLVSCDIDPQCGEGALKEDLKRLDLLPYWTFHGQPSQEMPVVEKADFLYVDGDHGYEAVRSDMARHGKAVRDGGLVVLDDYGFHGKKQWLDERWDILAPILVGPHILVTVTPEKRAAF